MSTLEFPVIFAIWRQSHNVSKLIYYEVFEDIENAIIREKQIKAGSREKKMALINSINSEWNDLYDDIIS